MQFWLVLAAWLSVAAALCGRQGNVTCPVGQCCGPDGYCGTSQDYCSLAANCQEGCWHCGDAVCQGVLELGGENCGSCPQDCGPCQSDVGIIRQCVDATSYALTFDDGPSTV